MSGSSSGIHSVPAEVLFKFLDFCPPKQNVINTRVSKSWQVVASEVVKKQILLDRQRDILGKAANFLKMVPEKLEFYCLSFAELEKIKMDHLQYSIKQVYDKALTATEKPQVCIANFLRVNPGCPNLLPQRKTDLAGKVFVELHFKEKITLLSDEEEKVVPTVKLWQESLGGRDLHCQWEESLNKDIYGGVIFLPIELFKLAATGDEHSITGNMNNGTFCFALRGRLIEMMLERGDQETQNGNFTGISTMSREKAHTIDVNPADAERGHCWPQNFYVPRLDAPVHPQ